MRMTLKYLLIRTKRPSKQWQMLIKTQHVYGKKIHTAICVSSPAILKYKIYKHTHTHTIKQPYNIDINKTKY
jgi:hypothetical protein